eukprot:CAMPEP_0194222234 /NCGR_PEP_ID=MMETSP0156-20130528/32428_1 /TAXON_ID=33649 /ORGANISM="Thalassionema nitzschioides, Strain L26-B" /LENGTH=624 /DNA_ID=CAMNT_0038952933 /DNA_START=142 /DNA_END=2013 /DNA_ORIENTATION=-
MSKEDPLHRLHSTPTKATENQRWDVFQQMEKNRKKLIVKWGVDENARSEARRIAAIPPPSVATRTPNNTPMKTPPRSSTNKTIAHQEKKKIYRSTPHPKKTKDSTRNTPGKRTPKPDVSKLKTSKLSFPDEEEMNKLFLQMDENSSGKLSLAELDKAVMVLYPEFRNKPALAATYKSTDVSGNGFIEQSEFPFFLHYLVYYNNLFSLFRKIDEDGDRRISRDEFLKASKSMELKENPSDLFDAIDLNGGGMILFDELCNYLAFTKSDVGMNDEDNFEKELDAALDGDEDKKSPTSSPASKPIPEAVMNISIPDKEKGMEIFTQLDENASGKLSLAELDKGVVILYPEFNNKPAIMAAYKAADRSGDGFVQRKEFGYFLRYLTYYNNLWSLFVAVDKDSDRRISRDEFVKSTNMIELKGDATDVFDEIDTNGGGMILFEELCNYMAINYSNWGADETNISAIEAKINGLDLNNQTEPELISEPEPVPEAVMKVEIPSKERAREIFSQIDENASGKLSLAELDKGVMILYPEFHNKHAIMEAYCSADRSANGYIERKEFGYFLRYLVHYNNLWTIFSSLDEDGDKRISKEEFLGSKLKLDRSLEEIFNEIDKNNGGMILFGELVDW